MWALKTFSMRTRSPPLDKTYSFFKAQAHPAILNFRSTFTMKLAGSSIHRTTSNRRQWMSSENKIFSAVCSLMMWFNNKLSLSRRKRISSRKIKMAIMSKVKVSNLHLIIIWNEFFHLILTTSRAIKNKKLQIARKLHRKIYRKGHKTSAVSIKLDRKGRNRKKGIFKTKM